jgi:hypothetical protein
VSPVEALVVTVSVAIIALYHVVAMIRGRP